MDVIKATTGLIALTPEIDYNQMTMGLPPVMSAVFLIAKQFWQNVGVLDI
jgi:hypothetical protein